MLLVASAQTRVTSLFSLPAPDPHSALLISLHITTCNPSVLPYTFAFSPGFSVTALLNVKLEVENCKAGSTLSSSFSPPYPLHLTWTFFVSSSLEARISVSFTVLSSGP